MVSNEFSGELPAALRCASRHWAETCPHLARPHFLQVVADGRVAALWPLPSLGPWARLAGQAAWVPGLGWLVSLIPEVEGDV